MTKEYIISEEQLKEYIELNDIFRPNAMRLADKIRSRPYNPEPAKAMPSCASSSDELSSKEKQAAINEERGRALKKLIRIRSMVKHAWEGERDTNPPDLGGILKFVEGFIAELRQQTGQTSAEQQRGRGV